MHICKDSRQTELIGDLKECIWIWKLTPKILEEPHFCHVPISHNNHLNGIAASTLSYTFDSISSNSHLKSLIFPDYVSGWSTLCGTLATTITNSCGSL